MSGKPIDAEDIAVLRRLQAALPDVGLNGWFEGVRVLARVIEHLTAAQQQGQAVACTCPSGDGSLRWPCPSHPPMQHGGEEAVALRAEQAAAVMPLIGPLLDAWERTHPDDSVHDSGIARYIEPINRAMEDGIAPSAPYSIDADADGIRARVADAITGALAFGAQGTHKPPAGHWLEPFWDMARADTAPPPSVPEEELVALVAGPYHYHHKMDDAAEREGKAFDRCRELTIQNIRTWCAMRRAMLAAAPALAQQPAAGVVDRDAVAKQSGALRELAAIIRKHGICPSLAIETVADRIDAALATQRQEPKP